MSLKVAVQMDPLEAIRIECDTTFLMMLTAQARGHSLFVYTPDRLLLESKSLKLFLHSFRNHGAFHEDCTVYVAKRFCDAAKPTWLRIGLPGGREGLARLEAALQGAMADSVASGR